MGLSPLFFFLTHPMNLCPLIYLEHLYLNYFLINQSVSMSFCYYYFITYCFFVDFSFLRFFFFLSTPCGVFKHFQDSILILCILFLRISLNCCFKAASDLKKKKKTSSQSLILFSHFKESVNAQFYVGPFTLFHF